MPTSDILARVQKTRAIAAEDALAVRRAVYGNDGAIDANEIDAMLSIDDVAETIDPSWTMLVSEAGADFLVHQKEPSGYIDPQNSEWLRSRIAIAGVVKTPRQFELLVHALELAASAPPELAGLALRQVELGIAESRGPLAAVGAARRVDREHVELLRRIIYAFGGHAGVAITHNEAEVLFDLNDAVAAADNDPAWDDLFVKAIANFMMAASGYAPPTREVAMQRGDWLDAPGGGIGGFIGKMAAGGLRGILDAYRAGDDGWGEKSASKVDAISQAEHVTEGEAGWLAGRIGRDGALHANEKALLRFIRDEAPTVHPSLADLIAKAA